MLASLPLPAAAPAAARLPPSPLALPAAPEVPSGHLLAEERTPLGTYVRTDLASLYAQVAWPMTPFGSAPGTVERFTRAFAQDAPAGVFVVFDLIAAHPAATLFTLDPGGGPFPAAAFMPGYFASVAPGALGLEVRVLTPAMPERPGARSLFGESDLLDVPHLVVMRYVDEMAADLRTLLTRSRSGDPMIGARVQTGNSPPRFLLFNARTGADPSPVVTTEVPAEPGASWMLFGLKPGAAYEVRLDGRSLVITERAGGAHTASAAGVLHVQPARATPHLPAFTYALAETAPVRVALCDVHGREVAVLTEGVHAPGTYVLPLAGVAPGRYVVQMLSPGGSHTQEITVPL